MAEIERKHRAGKGKPFTKGDPRICRDGALKSKGRQFQIKLREWLENPGPDGTSPNDKFQAYLEDIASAANKQSVDAIKLLWERAYGKPTQPIGADPESPGGVILQFVTKPPEANDGG